MATRMIRSRKQQRQPTAAEQRSDEDLRVEQRLRQQQHEQDGWSLFQEGSAQEHQQGNRQS